MAKQFWLLLSLALVATIMGGCGKDSNTPSTTTNAAKSYNVYYGTIHNHSNVSDGTGTPMQAYEYAKNTAGLDFFSLADHCSAINSDEWTAIKTAAESYNKDGEFVTFWGFEWSAGGTYGHVTVLNTDSYITASNTNYDTFTELVNWIDPQNCVAFFNHPGREDGAGTEFDHFTGSKSSKFVGMELWNKADGFTRYYYNDGYTIGDGLSYFDEVNNISGWRIGACGNDDNHKGTWGTANNSRFAVLATAKTRAAIYDAFQQRRFYATLDRNLVMSFTVNNAQMGAEINTGTYNTVIKLSDGDSENFAKVILYKNGVALKTWDSLASTTVNQTYNLTTKSGDYYYIKVTQADGDEAISSPVFVK